MHKDTVLFFARFPDGGIYATGPQMDAAGEVVPGGVMAYEKREMAQQVADVINGDVIERALKLALDRCQRRRIALYIRLSDGRTSIVRESVPEQQGEGLTRIEGLEREALLNVARRQTSRR